MGVDDFARIEIDLPNPHMLVFKYDAMTDRAELDTAFRGFRNPKFIGHG
jgi:hypothetical protein